MARIWTYVPATLLFAFLVLAVSLPARGQSKPADAVPTNSRPNILVIFADDLGWADLGVYGSDFHETPNLDRLAQQSVRFTDAHAAPLCSPSRAALLTGKYPAHVRIMRALGHRDPEPLGRVPERDRPEQKVVEPVDRNPLPLEERTVAEALKGAGYNTYHLGKWHLSYDERFYPHHQGFDKVVGVGGGGPGSYFSPYKIPMLEDGPEGEYLADRLTNETLQILENERIKDGPFFIYLAHHNVHGPWQAKREYVSHFTEKLTAKSRKDRKLDTRQRNPVYAAMVKGLDDSVGRIMERLEKLGLAENTVLIFVSDNGGITEITNPVPVTSNYPLRDGKASIYEGGVRVPMMVRWPGTATPGAVTDELAHVVDIYPTLLEAANVKPEAGKVLDGESLVPVLKGGELARDVIFDHFPWYMGNGQTPATYVRKGSYKLIRLWGEGPNRSNKHELYDLQNDIGEERDLSEQMPDKVAELSRILDRMLKDTDALIPVLNPDYDPDLAEANGRRGKKGS